MTLPALDDRAAWLEWRRQGIGASDTPIILGLSDYKTPFELFEVKTGRREHDDQGNFVTEKGNRLEPVARQKFSARYNLEHMADETFQPKLLQMAQFPHVRASLDGLSHDGKTLIEIKYQGKDAHANVVSGLVRPAYVAQIQHQLFVSGAEKAYLVSIGDDETVNATVVMPNTDYMAKILEHLNVFWGWVQNNRWPSESTDEQLYADLCVWERLGERIKELEGLRTKLHARITASDATVCHNFRIDTVTRKGSIKYQSIPVLKDLNLEPYRGADVVYKKISKC